MTTDSECNRRVNTLIHGLEQGDESALDQLLAIAYTRLHEICRKTLPRFPVVARWQESGDVLHEAFPKLRRSFEQQPPKTAQDFYRLSAWMIRQKLIELQRSYLGREGIAANYQSDPLAGDSAAPVGERYAEDSTYDSTRLAEWSEFHEQIDGLSEGRQVLWDLLFYQGLTIGETAVALDKGERTVRRWWVEERRKIQPPV